MISVKQQHLSGIPTTKTTPYNGKKYIIIHNTATPNATAANENTYFHNNWSSIQTFVHAFVDWTGDVYEHAPFGNIAWGAGNINPHAYLQVEQCISSEHEKNVASAKNVAEYVAKTIKANGYTPDDFEIISHDTASKTFGGSDHTDSIVGISFDEFLTLVNVYFDAKTATKPQELKEGLFRCNFDIKARIDGPDRDNKHIYTFKKGDTIKFDRTLKSNGYEWISQRRSDGNYWYLPIRELTSSDLWGTIERSRT